MKLICKICGKELLDLDYPASGLQKGHDIQRAITSHLVEEHGKGEEHKKIMAEIMNLSRSLLSKFHDKYVSPDFEKVMEECDKTPNGVEIS